jgi:hypothetical protein
MYARESSKGFGTGSTRGMCQPPRATLHPPTGTCPVPDTGGGHRSVCGQGCLWAPLVSPTVVRPSSSCAPTLSNPWSYSTGCRWPCARHVRPDARGRPASDAVLGGGWESDRSPLLRPVVPAALVDGYSAGRRPRCKRRSCRSSRRMALMTSRRGTGGTTVVCQRRGRGTRITTAVHHRAMCTSTEFVS